MIDSVCHLDVKETPLSDHALLSTTLKVNSSPRGRGVWKLNPFLLQDKDASNEVEALLKQHLLPSTSLEDWEALKVKIKKTYQYWGRRRAKESRRELQTIADAIVLLSKSTSTGPGIEEAIERLKKKHKDLMKKKWSLVKLRLKSERWENEAWASKYLINRHLGDCKHEMTSLVDPERGSEITDQKHMENYVTAFYENLYKKII